MYVYYVKSKLYICVKFPKHYLKSRSPVGHVDHTYV